MTTTRNLPQSSAPLREVLAFLAITFALALSLAIALPDAGINVGLTALLPTVTVVILTFTLFRRGTRRELWRSIGLGRAGLRSWGWAFGLPVLLCGGAFGTALLLGAGHLRALHLSGPAVGSFAALSAFIFLQTLIGALTEEVGWRGFMLPRVQQLTGRRGAALVTGFVHGCFHLPLILIATTYDSVGSPWIAAPVAVLLITAAGVFYAWLKDRSGSVWPVAVGHAFANTTFGWGFTAVASTTSTSLALVAGETGVATLATVAVLALVLLTTARVWKAAPAPTRVEAALLPAAAGVHDAVDA
jgi:membrane protease YdiL (CAAX protease family)